jgi:hypothetical protein
MVVGIRAREVATSMTAGDTFTLSPETDWTILYTSDKIPFLQIIDWKVSLMVQNHLAVDRHSFHKSPSFVLSVPKVKLKSTISHPR